MLGENMLKKVIGITLILIILVASSGVSFAADEEDSKVLDPYTDLGFKEFKDFKIDYNEIPEGNGAWHKVRSKLMPNFNDDLDALKKVMDYNANLANKLYANGTLNYTSGSKGRFQHVPVAVSKDMYYYDCKYDGYKDIIFAYLDQFNGLMTPLAVGLGALTAIIGAIFAIVLLVQSTALALVNEDAGVSADEAGSQGLRLLELKVKIIKWINVIVGLVGACSALSTGAVSGLVSQDKGDLMGYWKVYANYHADIKLEVGYLDRDPVIKVDLDGNNNTVENATNSTVENTTNNTENETFNATGNNTPQRFMASILPLNTTNETFNETNETDNYTGYRLSNQQQAPIIPQTNKKPYVDKPPVIDEFHDWNPQADWGDFMVWDHPSHNPRNTKIDRSSWRPVKWYCPWNAVINAGVGITLAVWWVGYTIAFAVSYVAYCFYFVGYNLYVMAKLCINIPKLMDYATPIFKEVKH
jgi:hypothetical protein